MLVPLHVIDAPVTKAEPIGGEHTKNPRLGSDIPTFCNVFRPPFVAVIVYEILCPACDTITGVLVLDKKMIGTGAGDVVTGVIPVVVGGVADTTTDALAVTGAASPVAVALAVLTMTPLLICCCDTITLPVQLIKVPGRRA